MHIRIDTILDSIADGVFTVDHDWRITSFNRAAEEITGVSREEAVGQSCREVLKADVCDRQCVLRYTKETGREVINRTVYIINAKGRRLPVSISTALLKDETGEVIGAVETFRNISREADLRKKLEGKYTFQDIISKSHKMQDLFDLLPDVAASTSTVLLQGESGTGKELVARAIHQLSTRKNRSFVAVNCAALPDALLEAELFGYKAGAFTDAKKDKPGRFKLADRGTIFLDEIGDTSPAMQVRLLRVLQEKTYEPLGGVESIRHDARIITASNRDLQELVREGKFREDLYYRINVLKLVLPPLRERMTDIPLLVDHFIRMFNALQNKTLQGVDSEALACLMAYDYPGNIRELENIIERAFILCKSEMIKKYDLPEFLRSEAEGKQAATQEQPSSLREIEAAFLVNALKKNQWHRAQTARELGIHKSTLFRRIKSLGISIPSKPDMQ
ncbi:MAG: sigma 54-interacting transcriptional regulator [Syntrophales bacterium]|jgi:PAS domain S-box-containing protein|nr:sigma 54-interacting transcriptional regulator [Syntrophales bacterium]MCK9392638.1 sigma 54-interacting transcriptional regulator [Syntrophales bacterium]